jgi:hypothetical protein
MTAKQDTSLAASRPRSGNSGKSSIKATRTGKSRAGRRRSSSFLANLVELIRMTYWGRVFLTLLFAAIVCLINILVSQNKYDLFFQLTGIELVLCAIIMWLRFLLRREA